MRERESEEERRKGPQEDPLANELNSVSAKTDEDRTTGYKAIRRLMYTPIGVLRLES